MASPPHLTAVVDTRQVMLEYSNKHRESDRPDITIHDVHAEATVDRHDRWAGLGALPTIYIQYPTMADPYTYHTVLRYRQVLPTPGPNPNP